MPKTNKGVEPVEETGSTIKKDKKASAPTSLDIARKAIQKKYGKIISYLGEHGDLHIPTLSTGSLGLDVALGRGGLARGRVYEIYGNPSGGKTTLAISVLIEAQKRGLKTVFIDAEHAIDPKLVKTMGADINTIELAQGFSGEDNLNVAEMYIKTGEIGLVIIDSVSALIPKSEVEESIEKDFIALLARLMSKALRRIVPIANETNTLVIFINQIRYKVSGFGNPESPTGGEALPFFATGRISVKGAEYKSNRINDPDGEVIGHNATIEVVKNKLAPPFRKTIIPLVYGKGFDLRWEVLNLAQSCGIIEKSGAWYSYEGSNIGQGELNVLNLLREDEDLYQKVRSEVIEATGLKELYERNQQ